MQLRVTICNFIFYWFQRTRWTSFPEFIFAKPPRILAFLLFLSLFEIFGLCRIGFSQSHSLPNLSAQIEQLLKQGDFQKAEMLFHKAIERSPNDPKTYQALADFFIRIRNLPKANTILEQMLKRFPDNADGWFMLGYTNQLQKRWRKATLAYRHAIQIVPTFEEAHYELARCLEQMGKFAEATEMYRIYQSIEKRPQSQRWIDQSKRSILILEARVQRNTKSTRESRNAGDPILIGHERLELERRLQTFSAFLEGRFFDNRSQYDDAQSAYEKALLLDGSMTRIYIAMGQNLLSQKSYAAAATIFDRSTRTNPNHVEGWYYLAYASYMAGWIERSIRSYQIFIARSPNDPDGYYGIAFANLAAGNTEKARRAFITYVHKEFRKTHTKHVQQAYLEILKLDEFQGFWTP